jgi:putative cardiolipin synthase
MNKISHYCCLLLIIAFTGGCASIDFDYPRTESTAPIPADTADTVLGRLVHEMPEDLPPGQSGFYIVKDGIDALALRLLMADRAEHTIDAQYYLIKNDTVGNVFLQSLLAAADRGVRVRLLIDDMFTGGYDTGLAVLDSHPNFEIRIFNPFGRRSARTLDSLVNFSRINRRMHNKSFTADNQFTIIGGRNIADEYFGASKEEKFGDLGVLGIGPVVSDISNMFDAYWNHQAAIPVPGFAKMPKDPASLLPELHTRLAKKREELENTRYSEAVRNQVLLTLAKDVSAFTWAPYQVIYDSPDKGVKAKAKDAASIRTPLLESLQGAQTELMIISAYFVLRKSGIEHFSELRNRGIDVTIITNSLASNNLKIIHGGYAPNRKPLLKQGNRIFEVRADATVAGSEYVAKESTRTTLHMKAYVVDRRELFIGSFNFDPRSANINTEVGVIIHSPELANYVQTRIEKALPEKTWEVFLNKDNKLRWRGKENGEEVIFKKEPQTSAWTRFVAGFYRILPIRGFL